MHLRFFLALTATSVLFALPVAATEFHDTTGSNQKNKGRTGLPVNEKKPSSVTNKEFSQILENAEHTQAIAIILESDVEEKAKRIYELFNSTPVNKHDAFTEKLNRSLEAECVWNCSIPFKEENKSIINQIAKLTSFTTLRLRNFEFPATRKGSMGSKKFLDSKVETIRDFVSQNDHIQTLDLSARTDANKNTSEFDDDHAEFIAAYIISHCDHLKKLDLRNQNIKEKGVLNIKVALEKRKEKIEILMRGNPVTNKAQTHLQPFVSKGILASDVVFLKKEKPKTKKQRHKDTIFAHELEDFEIATPQPSAAPQNQTPSLAVNYKSLLNKDKSSRPQNLAGNYNFLLGGLTEKQTEEMGNRNIASISKLGHGQIGITCKTKNNVQPTPVSRGIQEHLDHQDKSFRFEHGLPPATKEYLNSVKINQKSSKDTGSQNETSGISDQEDNSKDEKNSNSDQESTHTETGSDSNQEADKDESDGDTLPPGFHGEGNYPFEKRLVQGPSQPGTRRDVDLRASHRGSTRGYKDPKGNPIEGMSKQDQPSSRYALSETPKFPSTNYHNPLLNKNGGMKLYSSEGSNSDPSADFYF